MRALFLITVIAALIGGASSLHAQVPQLISYQGRIVIGTTNFDGSGQFKFALVNTDGSTTYWSNDGTSTAGNQPTAAITLTVSKGQYSVLLGDTTVTHMTTVPASVFNNSDVRLRVWFNDGTHGFQLLAPDQRIAAVGYAMVANVAQSVPAGAITSASIAAGAVGSTQLASNLTLSGTVSAANLAVTGGLTLNSGSTLTGLPGSQLDLLDSTALIPTSRFSPMFYTHQKLNNMGLTGHLRMLTVGDSLIANKVENGDFSTFSAIFGQAGLGTAHGDVSAGATANSGDFANWINGQTYTVPSSGIVTFSSNGTDPIIGDTIKLYYIKASAGGTFKLQTQLADGAWTDLAGYTNVSATNASPAGAVVSTTLPKGYYRVRILGLTGTSKIVGCEISDSTSPGYILSDVSFPGINIASMSTAPASITTPILSAMAPDLILFANAHGVTTTSLGNFYTEVETGAGASNDWLFIGISPQQDPVADVNAKSQNQLYAAFAQTQNQSYFDDYSHFISWNAANAAGLMLDGIHPNNAGRLISMSKMISEMNLSQSAGENPSSQTRYYQKTLAQANGNLGSPVWWLNPATLDSPGSHNVPFGVVGPPDGSVTYGYWDSTADLTQTAGKLSGIVFSKNKGTFTGGTGGYAGSYTTVGDGGDRWCIGYTEDLTKADVFYVHGNNLFVPTMVINGEQGTQDLLDLQYQGVKVFGVDYTGKVTTPGDLTFGSARATLHLSGNLSTSGANPITLTSTGPTNLTVPITGTLLTTTGDASGLTNVNAASLTGVISNGNLPYHMASASASVANGGTITLTGFKLNTTPYPSITVWVQQVGGTYLNASGTTGYATTYDPSSGIVTVTNSSGTTHTLSVSAVGP